MRGAGPISPLGGGASEARSSVATNRQNTTLSPFPFRGAKNGGRSTRPGPAWRRAASDAVARQRIRVEAPMPLRGSDYGARRSSPCATRHQHHHNHAHGGRPGPPKDNEDIPINRGLATSETHKKFGRGPRSPAPPTARRKEGTDWLGENAVAGETEGPKGLRTASPPGDTPPEAAMLRHAGRLSRRNASRSALVVEAGALHGALGPLPSESHDPTHPRRHMCVWRGLQGGGGGLGDEVQYRDNDRKYPI